MKIVRLPLHIVSIVLMLLSACAVEPTRAEPSHQAKRTDRCARVSATACEVSQRMGKGINMGGMLDAPEEGDWGTRLDPAFVDLVAGRFQTVRVPVRWTNHASADESAKIDEFFATRVTKIVDAFLDKDMYVILNVHNYSQIYGDTLQNKEFKVDDSVVETRLINIWRHIGMRFKDRPPKLIFELLNEPHGTLDAKRWNALAPKLLAAIRSSNPTRVVMIGPTSWNAIKALPELRLPDDENLIVQIHNYDPFNFTHQGIKYLPMKFPTGTTCCNIHQKAQITEALESATRWSTTKGYPIYLGEFGSFKAADSESRANYARHIRLESARLGISWAYWDFANAFGIYEPKQKQWIEPMKAALLD